jgi:Transposase zinc-binding domain
MRLRLWSCQSLARAQWLEQRKAELLPVEYFHVVFTLPEQIATIAFQNKSVVYDILFRATAETLLTIARDPQHLGAEIGFFCVLHTFRFSAGDRTCIIIRTCTA